MRNNPNKGTVLFFHSQQRHRAPAEAKLRGIYRFARACGWKIVGLEAPKSRDEVREQIRAWKPVGCLVDMNESDRLFTSASLGRTPTAFLDFDDRQLHGRTFRVNHDPDAVGALAALHLSALGLSAYAFVGYSCAWRWSKARKDAFREHLGRRAATFDSFTFPAGTSATSKTRISFLKWLKRLPKPCGVLLADDGLAEELYPACTRLGIRIPEDLPVLGVDDNERFCANLNPPLSSILLDFSQAGWKVAELLHRRISNPTLQPFVQTYNPLGIAPRGSTAIKVHRENPIAAKLLEIIGETATKGGNVSDICTRFDCSRRLLELRFRQATGKSILEAIRETRFNKACELLKNSQMPISAISVRCGYASDAALKSLFKTRTGLSMSVWRKRHPICDPSD